MLIRRLIPSVVRWSIWPLRWSTGEDTHRAQTGGLWEYLWYTHSYTYIRTIRGIFSHQKRHDSSDSVYVLLTLGVKFEMLTGTLPFQGKDRNETMNMILK